MWHKYSHTINGLFIRKLAQPLVTLTVHLGLIVENTIAIEMTIASPSAMFSLPLSPVGIVTTRAILSFSLAGLSAFSAARCFAPVVHNGIHRR